MALLAGREIGPTNGAATMIANPTPLRDRITNGLAILAILLAGVVWPPVFGATADNARAGTLYLCAMPCGAPTEALRQTTQIHAQVTGNVARVHVTQTFENPVTIGSRGSTCSPCLPVR